jgi:hypothetical protein
MGSMSTLRAEFKMMGWTAPERHRCARLAVMNRPDKGAVHDED